MARRRDLRRFGRGPYLLGLRRDPHPWGTRVSYDVLALADDLGLSTPVTLLAGDNGTAERYLRAAVDAADADPAA